MSWLFTRPEGLDDLVTVRSTLMEDARSFQPFIETYTSEKLVWAITLALHRFERFPPVDAFASLCAAFARQAHPG